MSHPVSGVDHCYLMVHDLDRSVEQFTRLGFTLSPRGFHSAAKGSANHTIMLSHDDYFELLGIVAETEDNQSRREMLENEGEGLYAIACRISSAENAEAGLSQLGIATTGVQRFDRPLLLANGQQAKASFSVLHFERSEVPLGVAFMCQHHTPDVVWQPQLMRHANTAVALAGAVAACDDPQVTARRYARLFAGDALSEENSGWQVQSGSIPITFLTRTELAQRYRELDPSPVPNTAFAALQVAVADLQSVEVILADAGVHHQRTAAGIAVAAADASGAIIEFCQYVEAV